MTPQNHEIRFHVTKEEHEVIKTKAEKARQTIKGFLLTLALNSNVKVEVE